MLGGSGLLYLFVALPGVSVCVFVIFIILRRISALDFSIEKSTKITEGPFGIAEIGAGFCEGIVASLGQFHGVFGGIHIGDRFPNRALIVSFPSSGEFVLGEIISRSSDFVSVTARLSNEQITMSQIEFTIRNRAGGMACPCNFVVIASLGDLFGFALKLGGISASWGRKW